MKSITFHDIKSALCAVAIILGGCLILGSAGASDFGSDANTDSLIIYGLILISGGTLIGRL